MSHELGKPGEFPYTRGIYPDMYRGRLWTMRQYAGFGTAEESNQRYRYLLSQGITGLSVAFDLPTQMGMDSDHPLAAGEVGRVGVAICSLADMERLFEGIPLDKVTTSMTINSTAAILLAFYVLVARRQGADARKAFRHGPERHPEGVHRARHLYLSAARRPCGSSPICSPGPAARCRSGTPFRSAVITFARPARPRCRKWRSRSPTRSPISKRRSAAGLDIDAFAPRLSFFFNAHSDFLEEIAKYRAARRLYAHLMRDRFGAKDPKSMMLRFHAQTAGSTLTAQQPDVNVVRVSLQALAAVLGGAQSLHTNSRDEALSLPTEESARLALRTQQIIAYESGVTNTADPFGGSDYIENAHGLDRARSREYIERIDAMGGTLQAIEKGFIQGEIQNAAYEYQKAIERGEAIVVGVNRFRMEERKIPTFRLDPALERAQIERLRQLRAGRDDKVVSERLQRLEQAARAEENLIPLVLDAAAGYATLGEISGRLKSVFGEYREAA